MRRVLCRIWPCVQDLNKGKYTPHFGLAFAYSNTQINTMESAPIVSEQFVDQAIDAVEFFANSSAFFRRVTQTGYDLKPVLSQISNFDPLYVPKIFSELRDGLSRSDIWVNFGISDIFRPVEMTLEDILAGTPDLWPFFAVHRKSTVRAKAVQYSSIPSDFHIALLVLLSGDDSEQVRIAAKQAMIRLCPQKENPGGFEINFILRLIEPVLADDIAIDFDGHFLGHQYIKSKMENFVFNETTSRAEDFAQKVLRADYFDKMLDEIALEASSISIRLLAAEIIGETISAGLQISNTPRHEAIMEAYLESEIIELNNYALDYLLFNPQCRLNCPERLQTIALYKNPLIQDKIQKVLSKSG